jgi:formamidopyrimidine-DNA glycosylase
MPELPEVEVVRRTLARHLTGETVRRVEVRAERLREPLDETALNRDAAGRRIAGLRRRAKYLLLDLEPPTAADAATTLVLHLGMSGRLTVREGVAGEPPEPLPHEHLVVHLASGRVLSFCDPRRFGQAFTRPTADLAGDSHFAHLGVEPLSETFDGAYLSAAARGRRGPVKPFLMDATVVVGVGNIYASEALFAAGIHPKRSVKRIAAARWDRLATAVRQVLEDALAQGGTTLNDFTDGEGNAGYFQVSLAVYGREGEPCPRCGEPIRRIVQAGRSTFYCAGCQT